MQEKKQNVVIRAAESAADIEQVRELLLEYAQDRGISLCFQGFDKEVAGLPGDYAPPEGRLLLAEVEGELAGCVALRPLAAEAGVRICEMKRLDVRPRFRGQGLGRALVERVMAEAREAGYRLMRLDTIRGQMDVAIAMYRRSGFREIGSYRVNPLEGVLYMEAKL